MDNSQKCPYEPPVMEEIEMNPEGIVCQSGGLTDYDRKDGQTW